MSYGEKSFWPGSSDCYNGDILYSYLRYLITIFTYQARQIQNYKSSSINIDIILYLHYLLFPFKIFSLSEVKPFA